MPRPIAARAFSIFSGVRTVLTEPLGFLLGAEAVVRNVFSQELMVLRSENYACFWMLKGHLNIHWVAITESSLKTVVCRRHSGEPGPDPPLLNGVPSQKLECTYFRSLSTAARVLRTSKCWRNVPAQRNGMHGDIFSTFSWMGWGIFVKLGTKIMPQETAPAAYFSIFSFRNNSTLDAQKLEPDATFHLGSWN